MGPGRGEDLAGYVNDALRIRILGTNFYQDDFGPRTENFDGFTSKHPLQGFPADFLSFPRGRGRKGVTFSKLFSKYKRAR
jgi:hypothetical protein